MTNSRTIAAVVTLSLLGVVACSNHDQGGAPVAAAAPTPAAAPVPPPAPVAPLVYECRTNGTGSPTYMKIDPQAKTVSMGREKDQYMTNDPAIFNPSGLITWTHVIEGQNWGYDFDPKTGLSNYGWGTADKGFSQQDVCKPI
jgi:hypothetical protein